MKPKVEGAQIELMLIQPVYRTTLKVAKDEEGKPLTDPLGNKMKIQQDKFIKEIYMPQWFWKSDITIYGSYLSSKGKPLKNRSLVYLKYDLSRAFPVAHSREEIHNAMNENRGTQIGFK